MSQAKAELSPLRNAAFRNLFSAQVIALVGTGMTTVALTLLAYDLAQENAGVVLGTALAFTVMNALYEPIINRGLYKIEASWILEENQAMRNIMEQMGGFVTKRYRMYQKSML